MNSNDMRSIGHSENEWKGGDLWTITLDDSTEGKQCSMNTAIGSSNLEHTRETHKRDSAADSPLLLLTVSCCPNARLVNISSVHPGKHRLINIGSHFGTRAS